MPKFRVTFERSAYYSIEVEAVIEDEAIEQATADVTEKDYVATDKHYELVTCDPVTE